MRLVNLLCVTAVSASVDITTDNFEEIVFKSGKATFVKFFAPWCGHCKSMAPAWTQLGEEFSDSKYITIGKVDCTGDDRPLCDRFDVKGFPTIKFIEGPDDPGETYSGGRDFEALKEYVATTMKSLGCSVKDRSECTEEQNTQFDVLLSMTPEERDADLTKLTNDIKDAESAHDNLLKELQAQFMKSSKELEEFKSSNKLRQKTLLAIKKSTEPPESSNTEKDEV